MPAEDRFVQINKTINEIFQSNEIALKCEISADESADVKYSAAPNVKYALRACVNYCASHGIFADAYMKMLRWPKDG